jgi:hypothetical protein
MIPCRGTSICISIILDIKSTYRRLKWKVRAVEAYTLVSPIPSLRIGSLSGLS